MEFLSLLIFVLGVTVAILTIYLSPDFAKAKPNKRNLSIIFLSIILVGIGLWLFHIDHYTYICSSAPQNVNCSVPSLGTVYAPSKVIPPPSYASLWPVFLASGIGLMGFSVLIQIVRSKK
ncbi:conserved pro-fuselloviral protein [Acidianus hospitalis W1]|uniref:Conserved pro-fuselloviral protein n=1 Tax=Acidianus hospitalis (strain W1) TaxID=933801 RepID=F4B6V8_ACIHW|nr:hypothetical protein [Acidianus hospitalis]AEE94651.1 conserved pro-fuselloviral protein [Acidianus hospitalis W1]